jgi:putative membrane protein
LKKEDRYRNKSHWLLYAAIAVLVIIVAIAAFDSRFGTFSVLGIGMGLMGLFGLFWLVLVILFFVWLFKVIFNGAIGCSKGRRSEDNDESYAILRKRYAKGEITKKEYEGMKEELDKE